MKSLICAGIDGHYKGTFMAHGNDAPAQQMSLILLFIFSLFLCVYQASLKDESSNEISYSSEKNLNILTSCADIYSINKSFVDDSNFISD